MKGELYMRAITLQIVPTQRKNLNLCPALKQHTALIVSFSTLLFLLLTSCQFQPVGGTCDENNSCERGLFCTQSVTGGYCTAICSQALPCPARAVCASIEGMDQNNNRVLLQRCLQPCLAPEDCRVGLSCQSLSVGQQKVCFPA